MWFRSLSWQFVGDQPSCHPLGEGGIEMTEYHLDSDKKRNKQQEPPESTFGHDFLGDLKRRTLLRPET